MSQYGDQVLSKTINNDDFDSAAGMHFRAC